MEPLIGRYVLKRHGTYDASGVFKPTSDSIRGELIYAADGALSVLIRFKAEPREISDLLAYTGRYVVVGEKILHHIHVCSQPAREGKAEEREYALHGRKLTLRVPLRDSEMFEAEWEKDSK